MLQPQAVIFDIGNVLIEWNPERFYDARIGPARRAAFMDQVPIGAANLAIDAGAPFYQTLADLAAAHTEWAREIMWWHDDWRLMVDPVIDASVALLRDLRARGVSVFALTNFGRETYDYALTQFDFLNEFDRAYVSGRLGMIKPDPMIYAHVEADCGIAPNLLLFADDRADNIAAAARRGWRTHQFEGANGFRARLRAEGLLGA
jgi:2-haloacid dehalogenase